MLSILQENGSDKFRYNEGILKVLVVDDEPTVHDITALVLKNYQYRGFRLKLRSAYSATEAREILASEGPFALILLDVIMETDDAGLSLVRFVRNELGDKMVRIILRTGQPGMVPRRHVMREFEIDDYKEKSELTSERFDSAVTASIRTFLGYQRLEQNRKGLIRILDGIREIESIPGNQDIWDRVLDQVSAILGRNESPTLDSLLLKSGKDGEFIVAGRGNMEKLQGKPLDELKNPEPAAFIRRSLKENDTRHLDNQLVAALSTRSEDQFLIYLQDASDFSDDDRYLVELYASHIKVSLDNRILNQQLMDTRN